MPRKSSEARAQPFGMDRPFTAVYKVRSIIEGQPEMCAVQIHEAWHLFNPIDILKGKVDVLFRIAQECNLTILEKKELLKFGRWIVGSATSTALYIPTAGYHVFEFEDEMFEVLVWRGEAHWIGDPPSEIVIVDPAIEQTVPVCQGSVREWRESIGVHMRRNPYMLVTLGAALSALLIEPLELDPLMLVLVGPSSSGKTSVQKAVESIIRPGEVPSATGTVLGLHQWMSRYPGQPLFIQETRQVSNTSELVNLVFDHGNGGARMVGTATQNGALGQALKCVLIASNEQPLAELARRKSVVIDPGAHARLFELVVDGPRGAFHDVPDGFTAAEFAQNLSRTSTQVHGALWDEWVSIIAANCSDVRAEAERRIPELRDELLAEVDVQDPVFSRLVNGYAVWMFALFTAQEYGLIKVKDTRIQSSFVNVLKEYAERYASGMTPNECAVIDAVRAAIDENQGRFSALNEESGRRGSWGYTRTVDGEKLYLVFRSTLRELASGFTEKEILDALRGANYLKHNRNELMYSVRVSGGLKRFYAIKGAISFDG